MSDIGKSLIEVVQNDEQLFNALNGLEYKLAYLLKEHLKETTQKYVASDVAERLMLARKKKGLTQTKLQVISGINQVVLSELESAKRPLTFFTANRLSKHLGVTAKYLLFGDDDE